MIALAARVDLASPQGQKFCPGGVFGWFFVDQLPKTVYHQFEFADDEHDCGLPCKELCGFDGLQRGSPGAPLGVLWRQMSYKDTFGSDKIGVQRCKKREDGIFRDI